MDGQHPPLLRNNSCARNPRRNWNIKPTIESSKTGRELLRGWWGVLSERWSIPTHVLSFVVASACFIVVVGERPVTAVSLGATRRLG